MLKKSINRRMSGYDNFMKVFPSNEIKKVITYNFFDLFFNNLCDVFPYVTLKTWKKVCYLTGTYGWNDALRKTCDQLNEKDFIEYYDELEPYHSDQFDSDLLFEFGKLKRRKIKFKFNRLQ